MAMTPPESPRLRVLLFTNLFPNPVDGTRGIFTEQLARELGEICDVTVICPLPWFPNFVFLRRFPRWFEFAQVPAEYSIRGTKVFSPKYIVLPRVSEPILGALMTIGAYLTVRRLHRAKKFDVINSMWLYPDSVAAGWIARRLGIPMVPTALGCDVNRMLNEGDKRRQILSMLQNARSITAVSEALRDGMVTHGIPGARISTIPNGVDISLFHLRDKRSSRESLGLPSDKKIVLYVGRLSEEKGLTTIVKSLAKLKSHRSDFLFCLVGDGPIFPELKALAQSLNVAENFLFAGQKDHVSVADWLGACDVFCLPSLREGCPNVVIEALSSGRPVVASRVGGIPDMVGVETGILVEPQDVEGFANALDAALYARTWDEARIADSMNGATWRSAAERYNLAYRRAIADAQLSV